METTAKSSINTLVQDIYKVLQEGKQIDDSTAEEFGKRMASSSKPASRRGKKDRELSVSRTLAKKTGKSGTMSKVTKAKSSTLTPTSSSFTETFSKSWYYFWLKLLVIELREDRVKYVLMASSVIVTLSLMAFLSM